MNTRGEFADLQAGEKTTIMPITLQMSDLINPTTIKTSYSKTITLPRTDTNDKIFSQYFKLDKLVYIDSFNALEKTPFILYINGTQKLFEGWIRLNKITKDGYEINLFSNEGKLFNTLAEKKLNEINLDLTHRVGRNVIWNGWNTNDGQFAYLKYAPAYQGLYPDFTSNKTLSSTATSTVDLTDDIDEYNKFELRSYYQHPAIKLSKIIESICTANNIYYDSTKFDTVYWNNTYMVNNKWYFIDKPASIFKSSYRSDQAGTGTILTNASGLLTTNTVGRVHSTTISDDYDMETSYRLDLSKYPSGTLEINYEFDIEIEAALSQEIVDYQNELEYTQYVFPTHYRSTTYPDNGGSRLAIRSYISGQNNAYTDTFLRYGVQGSFSQYTENYDAMLSTAYLKIPTTYTLDNYEKFRFLSVNASNYYDFRGGIQDAWYNALPTTYRISGKSIINNDGTDKFISFTLNGYNAETNTYTTPAFRIANSVYLPNYVEPFYKNTKLRFRVVENNDCKIIVKPFGGQIRSNYKVTKENLFDPDINQAEFLLNYMKLFGLVCSYDKVNQRYVLQTRNDFYENETKIDWTYKVNPDEIDLNPNNIDARKYVLKYGDLNTTHYQRYKDVFGTEYGSVYIDTNNQHYDNTEEFYSSLFSCPLMEQSYNIDAYNNQYRLPWKALGWCSYSDSKRSASIPDKPTLMFWNGLNEQIPPIVDMKPYMILSDDNYVMRDKNEFFWSNYPQKEETNDSIIKMVNAYGKPVFPEFSSLIPGSASLEFGVPKVTFFETNPGDLTDNICLYKRFYDAYVNDKLSVHNRVIEIPVNLTNDDIMNFNFNAFYCIKETPFIVIEIKDYNPNDDNPTIVKMQKVVDISNYSKGQKLTNLERFYRFNNISKAKTSPYLTNVQLTYDTLTGEKGLYYNGMKYVDAVSAAGIINLDVERPLNDNYIIVRPFVGAYWGDEIKLTFADFNVEFSGFTFTEVNDKFEITLEYTTNANVLECGLIIAGETYVNKDNSSPIYITGITPDAYNVVGYIKTDKDTYMYSNNYITY